MEGKTQKMTVEEPKELPLIDEGDYKAKVTEVETDVSGRHGDMVRIHFDVKGEDITALASQQLNPNTKLYKWAGVLLGKEPKIGEELDLQEMKGKAATVTVRNREVLDQNGKVAKGTDGKTLYTSVVKEVRKG